MLVINLVAHVQVQTAINALLVQMSLLISRMEFVQKIPSVQKVFLREELLALHAQLIVSIVFPIAIVILVSMDSNYNHFHMVELQPVTVYKNVVTVKDLNLIVMMEIIKMVMDVHQIVKYKLDGLALVDQAQEQALVFKELQKELILNLQEQFICTVE